MAVMVMVWRHVDPIGRLQRVGIQDLLGMAFTTDDSIECVDPRCLAEDHGKVMRDQNNRDLQPGVDSRDELVKALFSKCVDPGRRFVQQQQLRPGQPAVRKQPTLEWAASTGGARAGVGRGGRRWLEGPWGW